MTTRKLNLTQETKELLRKRAKAGTEYKGKLMLDLVNPEANKLFDKDYGVQVEDALMFLPIRTVVTKLRKIYEKYNIEIGKGDKAYFHYLDYLQE